MRAEPLNYYSVRADSLALLSQTLDLKQGNVANVDGQLLIFNAQRWMPMGEVTHQVPDLAAQNALKLPKLGTIVHVNPTQGQTPRHFIYTGDADWLNLGTVSQVDQISERDALNPHPGDLVKVADIGDGHPGNFFFADGQWQSEVRGGDAGNINIEATGSLHLSGDSAISTEAVSAGGGELHIHTDGMVRMQHSQITSTVQESYGHGGDLRMNTEFLVQDQSPIIARAMEGDGGNILIQTSGIYQFPPFKASPIDASSQFGVDGNIDIRSPAAQVTESMLALSTDFLEDEIELGIACSKRETPSSRFIVKPRSGVANPPGDLQATGLWWD